MDSKTIFELRKESQNLSGIEKLNKLNGALSIARNLYSKQPYDEWIKKAFAWVLIDLCKYYLSEINLNQAGVYYNELITIDFQGYNDDIIENQKNFLRSKIDANYSEVQRAEELSKNGNNKEALAIFKTLIAQNRLTELHHESYGWVIYRYIKAEESNLSSIDVRTFLRDYMNLKNERPSMLHSMILNFALNYSKTHSDFKFYNFFLLWNPDNLRHEDLHDGYKDGKSIPSLISRICREFINSNTEINFEEFLSKIDLSKETILDFFRESIFWNIFNAHKENKFSKLWNLFEQYNNNYSKHGESKWHSEILNLAERFMKENDEWHFLNFFKNWNPENLRNDDWKETKKDEHTYKPLATKALKKTFEILKTQTSEQDLSWLIKPYETAIKLFPDDEWLLREKALLHFKNNELELAIKIYKQLVLELSSKHYVWQEFSDCIISDNSLKIGMLSKALSLEKNEDFLGDIHLHLAKALIDENLLENALVELEAYKKHREIKGWKLSSVFDELHKKVSSVKQSLKDNREVYKKYIPFAENFAYADFDWTEIVLVDKWKDDKGKERLTFTDGKTIDFAISKNRFETLKQSELGQILKFKLHKQEIKKEVEAKFAWFGKTIVTEHKYIPLIAEKSEKKHWEILEDTFAIVDYINKEKNIIHVITSDNKKVFFPQIKGELQIGDFITAKSYIKKVKDENRTELKDIQKIDKDSVISKYQTQIAIVDGVNEQKQLFHFVLNPKLQGVIKYSETRLRPNEGDFIKLSFATKTDKDKKLRVKILNIELTEETNTNLRKDITGVLEVKYKDYNYDENIPDFAFIGDYYIPKYLLQKHNITNNCRVNARVIYGEDKMKRPRWKVIGIEKLN
ncbi:tetratricopeptide repeat protein [Flavobacterium microcysteis]